jgi:TonB-linked SusC/RagA family outer membrane protein
VLLPINFKSHSFFYLLIIFSLISVRLSAQQQIIKGKITDVGGNPLNGVTVGIGSTNTKVVSTADGAYLISVALQKGQYELIFSFVGYKVQKHFFLISDLSTFVIDAVLQEDQFGLDEVVVTGTSAGTTKKQLGSYIATVKASDLSKGAASNAFQALQGKTPGAVITQNNGDPAGGLSVRLRGVSSINSSSEPLYIVDGVIVSNNTTRVTNTQPFYDGARLNGVMGQSRMVDINPDDIEKIEVLNGAAAAAIYGSRANSGVIQIFTKRGKSGIPQVKFSSSTIINSLRKRLEFNQAPIKFGGPTDGPGAQTMDILSPGLTNTTAVKRYDYQDLIFQTGMGTDNNASISGGNENTKYYLSASYFYNQGIIRNTDFQRFNFRTNIDQKVTQWLSLNVGLNYINSNSNEKPDGTSFFSPMNTVNILGNFHDLTKRDADGNLKTIGNLGRVNPVSVINDFKQINQTSRMITSLGAKLRPFKGLSVDYTMGIDNYAQFGKTLIPPYAYNVNATFFGGGTTTIDPTLNGYASTANSNFFGINHDINATYNFKITSKLESVTQVGFLQQYEKNEYAMLQGRGLAPFVETVTGASTIMPGADSRSELSLDGIFVQQNFKFDNYLFLTGAVRRDGSSVFGPAKRNQVYKKANASFLISETHYWQKIKVGKWWNLAKIRLAYGESGNLTGIGAYDRFNVYAASSFNNRTSFNSNTIQVNPNLGPERQTEIEFGIDLAFLDNRINFMMNVYDKRVDDMLLDRVISPSTGFSSLLDNIGNLKNTGFEMMLTGTPIQNKKFTWNVSGIFNRNRNEVLNIGSSLIQFLTNQGASVALIQGYPVGVFYGTFFARVPGGSYSTNNIGLPNHNGLVLSPAGIPRQAYGIQTSVLTYEQKDYLPGGPSGQGIPVGSTLRKIIGDPNPDYTTSLINEFSFGKWNIRIQIDATKGNDVWNGDFRTRQGAGSGKIAELEHNGKIPRGYVSAYSPNALFPTGLYNIEEWRIQDGSNMRLREFSASYSFGKLKNVFKDLSLSFSGRNLFVWTQYMGYDPEVNAGGQSTLLRGIDFGSVPIPRTINIGFQAKF